MTPNAFFVDFPEFRDIDVAYVSSALRRAANHVGESMWGSRYNEGLGLYAAHLLVIGPQGQMARLKKDSSKDTYLDEFDRLAAVVTLGLGRNS